MARWVMDIDPAGIAILILAGNYEGVFVVHQMMVLDPLPVQRLHYLFENDMAPGGLEELAITRNSEGEPG